MLPFEPDVIKDFPLKFKLRQIFLKFISIKSLNDSKKIIFLTNYAYSKIKKSLRKNISYEIIGIQLNRIVFEEVDKNRKFYSQLKKEDFLKDEFIDKSKWSELLNAFSIKNKIDFKSSDYETMINSIKSILVFQLFDRKTQIEINNTNDPYIFEAIKILK